MEQARILVCEDEPLVALDLRRTLEQIGYQVLGTAGEAETALEMVSKEQPDLALMDIKLNGQMSGIQLAQVLHERYQIPSIYLSAHANRDLIEQAKSSNPLGYLVKPYRLDELLSTIEVGLSRHRKRGNLLIPFADDFLRREKIMESGISAWRIAKYLSRAVEPLGQSLTELTNITSGDDAASLSLQQCLVHQEWIAEVLEKLQCFSRPAVLERQSFALSSFVQEIERTVRGRWGSSLELATTLPPEPLFISAAHEFLRDALIEVLEEAASATPNGGTIQLAVKREFEELPERYNCHAAPGWYLVLSVSDTGQIPPEELPIAFEPCYLRHNQTLADRIGYFLAHAFAYHHSGWVNLRSDPDSGTVVSIHLPQLTPSMHERGKTEVEEKKSPRRILVIDDEPTNVEVMQHFFQKGGCECYGFNNPVDGLAWYSHHIHDVDLVFLDLDMPVINGNECFRRIRKLNQKQRIALMSGCFEQQFLEGIDRNDVAGFFQKPFQVKAVVEWAQTLKKFEQ